MIENGLRPPEDHMLTLNEWLGQKIGTDNWYVGESGFTLAQPLSLACYEDMRAEYLRLYRSSPSIGVAPPPLATLK